MAAGCGAGGCIGGCWIGAALSDRAGPCRKLRSMTLDHVLALFARVPVRFWPVLVLSLVRVAGEIEAAFRQGRSGWICYDCCGRVWLELYPLPEPHWCATLERGLDPARRRLARALAECAPQTPAVSGVRPLAIAFPTAVPGAPLPAPAIADTS